LTEATLRQHDSVLSVCTSKR